jgi:hypothetical protein
MQDSKGYMWFGTDQGVSRFDGYRFRNFGREEGLTSHVIFTIKEDTDKNIWMSSMTGEVFIYRNEKLIEYPYNDCILRYKRDYYSSKLLHIDQEGTAYFDLKYVGILQIDKHGNTKLYSNPAPLMYLILPMKDAVVASNLYRVREVRLSPVPVPTDPDYYMPIAYYESDSSAKFITSTGYQHGAFSIFLVDTLSQVYLLSLYNQYLVLKGDTILADVKDAAQFNGIKVTKEGEILCAMHKKAGLRKYNSLQDLLSNKYTVLLPDKFCSYVVIDKDGGLWVSTLENGIYYCKNPNLAVFGSNTGLSDEYIISLALAGERKFYLGLRNGNVAYLDLDQSICRELQYSEKFYQLPVDLNYDSIHNCLLTGSAWMDQSLNSTAYRRKDGDINALTKIFKFGNRMSQNYIYAHNYNVLHNIDLTSRRHEILYQEKDRNRIYSIFLSKDSTFWVGKQSGLFIYKAGQMRHCGLEHPVFHSRIEELEELEDSTLVLGTKGYGLVFLKGKSFMFINKIHGLTSDFINDLHKDQDGTLWIATNMGLNRLDFLDGQYALYKYTTSNGLPANEIYKIDSYIENTWIATRKGLVCIPEITPAGSDTQPLITGYYINGQFYNSISKKVKYRDNDIKIEFITLNYNQEGKVPYRYRLRGNMPWTITLQPGAEFMSLGHGTYNFEVQSQNERGIWSNSTVVSFRILPPIYLDFRFWILISFLIILFTYLFIRWRVQRFKESINIRYAMDDLKRKAIQAQMNPHFIFNALNSIQSYVLHEDKFNALHYLNMFSELIRKTLTMSDRKEISLVEVSQYLDQYLSLEKLRFEDKFDYTITIDPSIDSYETYMPPLLIQPLVENAVVHAFEDIKYKGEIKVDFKVNDQGYLEVIVSDNGKGFDIHNIKERHQSFGLDSVRRRLEILDQNKGMYSLNIQSGNGTVAILKTGIKIIPNHVTENI